MGSDVQRSDVTIESFESRFGAQVHAVSGCRRDFVGWMRGAHIDGGTVDDLAVVFSELAANAVDASASPERVAAPGEGPHVAPEAIAGCGEISRGAGKRSCVMWRAP